MTSDTISIDKLQADEKNANLGTTRGRELLVESLARYRAGRSVLVDSKGKIISGNKTWEAAKQAGFTKVRIVPSEGDELVAVQRMDLDLDRDAAARELAYMDNRSAELNLAWDLDQMAEDLENGVDFGHMWNQRELQIQLAEALAAREADQIDDISPELPGAQALKMDMTFPSDEPYDIPPLIPEMLSPCPEPIDTWAGKDVSDLEWAGWWLYNYGTDSIRGLDLERTVLAFYTSDNRFENWFSDPATYVGRALNAGIGVSVGPNFSLWEGFPLAMHVFNSFRSKWLARYMQEAGIAIIPDVDWGDPRDLEFCLAGIPKRPPCISIQVQCLHTKRERGMATAGMQRVLKDVDPQSVMLYGGGEETRLAVAGVLPDQLPVIWIESRSTKRQMRRGQSWLRHAKTVEEQPEAEEEEGEDDGEG